MPNAAILAKLISTKPGLKTIKDPINQTITAIHLLIPTFSPKKIVDNIASMIVVSTVLSFVTIPIIVFISLKYFF